MAQQHPQHQVDSRYLEKQQVSDFRALLRKKLAAGPKSSVEEAWCTLRESMMSAQSCFPTIPEMVEVDWATDAVCEASRKKRDMWTRCQKSPGDKGLRQQYMLLRARSRQCADKVQKEWWETKTAEAEWLYESAARLGSGGSLLKDL